MTTLLGFDSETTGLVEDYSIPSDDPSNPHLVQLAAKQIDAESREVIQSMDFIVFPNGWIISKESIAMHGIDNHKAAALGLQEKDVVGMFIRLCESSDKIFAHNASFDKKIIRIALMRHFGRERADWFKNKFYNAKDKPKKTICTMYPSKKAFGGGSLEHAYKSITGESVPNAHNAMADVVACETILWGLVDRGHLVIE